MAPRYHVATVSGYLSEKPANIVGGPGLSAHVVDSLHAAQVVGTFRSEDRLGRTDDGSGRDGRSSLGKRSAIAAATALADELNADDAR